MLFCLFIFSRNVSTDFNGRTHFKVQNSNICCIMLSNKKRKRASELQLRQKNRSQIEFFDEKKFEKSSNFWNFRRKSLSGLSTMSESTASRIGRFGSEAVRGPDGDEPDELEDLVSFAYFLKCWFERENIRNKLLYFIPISFMSTIFFSCCLTFLLFKKICRLFNFLNLIYLFLLPF
jgi:hypothetical protein